MSRFWLLSAALVAATPGYAADPLAAAAVPADCELHVWPGNDLRSTYSGWFHGGIADGAVQGRDGYKPMPTRPLGTERQLAALRALPLAEQMGLRDYRLVFHEAALDSRTLRTTVGRWAPGTPACYAELAVDDVFFQEDIIAGRFLKVLFRFRKFDGQDAPARTFGSYAAQKLSRFPPKSPGDDPQPALDELATAFSAAITEFEQALNKPPKPQRRKRS